MVVMGNMKVMCGPSHGNATVTTIEYPRTPEHSQTILTRVYFDMS